MYERDKILTEIAVQLKRIADTLEHTADTLEHTDKVIDAATDSLCESGVHIVERLAG